jgi:hypothetical protein
LVVGRGGRHGVMAGERRARRFLCHSRPAGRPPCAPAASPARSRDGAPPSPIWLPTPSSPPPSRPAPPTTTSPPACAPCSPSRPGAPGCGPRARRPARRGRGRPRGTRAARAITMKGC